MSTQQRINVIYSDNGQGLSRDAVVVRDALRLAGHRPWLTPLPPRQFPMSLNYAPERARWAIRGATERVRRLWARRSWDVNIFIETVVPEFFESARINCFIPNQEWLSIEARTLMRAADVVLFKTKHAMRALSGETVASAFIGFTSLDRKDPQVEQRLDSALHVAGWNPHKGTTAVIAAWSRHAEWPRVTVISQGDTSRPTPANVDLFQTRVPDRRLRRLQNACGVHVCPSEVEGFGHSLMEGMSCGAVIVATDAPPMNELVSHEEGFLVPHAATQPMGSGVRYLVDTNRLAEVLNHVWTLDGVHLRRLGQAARAKYENCRSAFERRIARVVRDV